MRTGEDRALFRRGKHGALVSRVPATGSSLPGGSINHRSGRKHLNEAIKAGKPILCRESDGVAIRAASFEEVIRAHQAPDGKILVNNIHDTDGITWGCLCVVRKETVSLTPVVKFDPTPRLRKPSTL